MCACVCIRNEEKTAKSKTLSRPANIFASLCVRAQNVNKKKFVHIPVIFPSSIISIFFSFFIFVFPTTHHSTNCKCKNKTNLFQPNWIVCELIIFKNVLHSHHRVIHSMEFILRRMMCFCCCYSCHCQCHCRCCFYSINKYINIGDADEKVLQINVRMGE